MSYNKLWDSFYNLSAKAKKGDNVKDELLIIAKRIAEEANNAEDMETYNDYAKLYYQCEGMLMLLLDECIPQEFPSPNGKTHKFPRKTDGLAAERCEINTKELAKTVKEPILELSNKLDVLSKSIQESKAQIKDSIDVAHELLKKRNGFFNEDFESNHNNKNLLRENEHINFQIKAIDKINRIINSSFRDSELLHAIMAEVKEIIPFTLATVMTLSENRAGHLVIFEILSSGPNRIARGSSFPMEGTIFERVIRQDALIVVDDLQSLKHPAERRILSPKGSRSAIIAPLRMEGGVKGVLTMTAPADGIFGDRKALIGWMANTLAFAIERNNLSAAVYKRDRELGSIKQIGSALASSTFEMKQVLKYTMDMIRVIMNVEAGSLLFLKGDELKFAVAFNTKVKSNMTHPIRLGQGIAGYVAAKGTAIIVSDTNRSPHFFAGVDRSTGFTTRSALCVPMISKGRVIGVIEVLNKINGDFTEGDEDLLQSIASSVSIAIENARLYRETVSMAEHERSIRRMFQKFVPKEVLDRILHGSEGGKTVIEELRTLTLLNLNIRGFSILSKDIGPQKTVSLLNRFFSIMGEIVFKHHGIVDKYLGDGFLAIFGAPVASPRDADNALNAALEMRRALKHDNRMFRKAFGTKIKTGTSILTGEVVVGNIGFEKKMDYTVIGDVVNALFRLQDMTRFYPDCILVGETTHRACLSSFNLMPIEETMPGLNLYALLDEKEDPASRGKIVERTKSTLGVSPSD